MTYPEFQDSESDKSANALDSPLQSGESGPQSGWLSGSKGLILGLGLGLAIAFLGGRFLSNRPTDSASVEQAGPSQSITTARAQPTAIRQTVSTSGTVQAYDLLAVAPRTSGLQIEAVRVDEGDRVTSGQVLAVLDDTVLQAELQQAKADVAAARAQVQQAQAARAQAVAAEAEAQENFQRYQSLFDQGAISAEELTKRRTQLATEREQVQVAIADIDSAEATVASRQADVTRIEAQLDQTQVLAPADGMIAESNATVGDTVATSEPLFTLIRDDLLELAVKLPQTQLPQISVGAPVQVSSDSDESLQVEGSVRAIDPLVNQETRQAVVKVSLPSNPSLRPGMFLQADIVTGRRQGLAVPAAAVLPQSDGSFRVYTVDADNIAQAQPVETGARIPTQGGEPAQIEIVSGLEAGSAVVVEGASYLQDGDRVQTVADEL